jgi:predicted DNA-binding protein
MKTFTFKLNVADAKKLKSLKGDKPVSTYIRKLINDEHERSEESISMTAEFLKQIKDADLLKISESVSKIDMEKIMRYLNRILTESAKARISIERYAGRDFQHAIFQLFEADVKVAFKEYVESWNKQKGGE